MFRQGARVFVGLVVADSIVVDLSRANVGAPATLKELIARWDRAMADRLQALAIGAGRGGPVEVIDLSQLKTLPPIDDPNVILNAAVNYQEHAAEMRSGNTAAATAAAVEPNVARGISGMWARRPGDARQNPYFFLKAKSAIIGSGDPILLPPDRTQIDWECELNVVIGKTASRVKAEQAAEYICAKGRRHLLCHGGTSALGRRLGGRPGSDNGDSVAPTPAKKKLMVSGLIRRPSLPP